MKWMEESKPTDNLLVVVITPGHKNWMVENGFYPDGEANLRRGVIESFTANEGEPPTQAEVPGLMIDTLEFVGKQLKEDRTDAFEAAMTGTDLTLLFVPITTFQRHPGFDPIRTWQANNSYP